jgi:hypothetical protein
MEFAIIIQAIDTTTTLYSATKRISSNIKMSKLDSKIWRWQHLYGIVMPRFSGKSDLTRRFKSREVMFFDIDAICLASFSQEKQLEIRGFIAEGSETSYATLVFPAARKIISELADSFADKRIVLISSHIDLIKFLGVMKCNRLVLKPSASHYRAIPKACNEIEAERILSDYTSENMNRITKTYESFEALHRIIQEKFKVLLKA